MNLNLCESLRLYFTLYPLRLKKFITLRNKKTVYKTRKTSEPYLLNTKYLTGNKMQKV